MRKHPQIVIGVLLIALFVCIAITAPLLAPNDPNATNLALKNAPISRVSSWMRSNGAV